MFWKKYSGLSDADLVAAAELWAATDRKNTIELLGILIAADDRDLPTRKGYPTLFKFCTEKLRFSEAMAYWRIRTARAVLDHPPLAGHLEAGSMNLTTITILSPYLSEGNRDELIGQAAGKTRKEVEAMIASMSPSAPRRDVVTRQGPMLVAKGQWPAPPPSAPLEQKALDIVEALDAERRRLHFDVGPDTADLLERAREILRHKYPFASLEDIVKEALNVLLDHKDFDRKAATPSRQPAGETEGRAIPMWVRKAVWVRDEGRCVYAGDDGAVCGERSFVEFDHVIPYAKGGRSDDPGNVRLLCRAHNQLAARQAFGRA